MTYHIACSFLFFKGFIQICIYTMQFDYYQLVSGLYMYCGYKSLISVTVDM